MPAFDPHELFRFFQPTTAMQRLQSSALCDQTRTMGQLQSFASGGFRAVNWTPWVQLAETIFPPQTTVEVHPRQVCGTSVDPLLPKRASQLTCAKTKERRMTCHGDNDKGRDL